MASEKKIFEYFFENLAFRLPWQQIKINDLDKTHLVGKGLLYKAINLLLKLQQCIRSDNKMHLVSML